MATSVHVDLDQQVPVTAGVFLTAPARFETRTRKTARVYLAIDGQRLRIEGERTAMQRIADALQRALARGAELEIGGMRDAGGPERFTDDEIAGARDIAAHDFGPPRR